MKIDINGALIKAIKELNLSLKFKGSQVTEYIEKLRIMLIMEDNEILLDVTLSALITQYELEIVIKNEIKKYLRNINIEKIIN